MALKFKPNEITFESQEYSFLKIGGSADSNELNVYDFKNAKELLRNNMTTIAAILYSSIPHEMNFSQY